MVVHPNNNNRSQAPGCSVNQSHQMNVQKIFSVPDLASKDPCVMGHEQWYGVALTSIVNACSQWKKILFTKKKRERFVRSRSQTPPLSKALVGEFNQ